MKSFDVEGKKYMLKRIKHNKGDDKLELVPFPKDYEERITKIAKQLQKPINKVDWLKQVLYRMDLEYIEQIEKAIKKKKKMRANKGCYEVLIGEGKSMLPITLTD